MLRSVADRGFTELLLHEPLLFGVLSKEVAECRRLMRPSSWYPSRANFSFWTICSSFLIWEM